MKEKNIVLSIITPTWNNEDYTIRCFDSISKNTKENFVIIWVDNASEKKSREKVVNFLESNNIPHIAILNDENKGFVGGTNQGIEKALEINSPYTVFQNNDTEVFDDWDVRMIEVAEANPDTGLVGPITSPCDSWQSIDRLRKKFDQFKSLPKYDRHKNDEFSKTIKKQYKDQIMDVGMVAFFSTLFRTEAIRQIGPLSTDFGLGFGDDDDYCMRAKKQGWKLSLACDVFVFHNHRTTFSSKFSDEKIKEMQEENLQIFHKRHKDFIIGSTDPKELSYYTSIIRKGYRALRKKGLRGFVYDVKNYLKHGRDYFN